MGKDLSRRSSTAGSAHVPSPTENGTCEETPAQESQQSGEAAENMSRSASLMGDSSRTADSDTLVARAVESQPMTASNSTSSNPSTKDVGGSGTGAAAPYGTRSRNRTGTSRPNYAEDKELDAEFEISTTTKDSLGRKSGRAADPAPSMSSDPGRAANITRKILGLDSDQIATAQSHYKEPIPGTSTFSANPAATAAAGQSSKKRKAPNQPAATMFQPQLQIPTQSIPTTQAVTRRASIAAQVAGGFRESNMLSFDDCGGRLKGKKLVADDGTILEVNGELNKQRGYFSETISGALKLTVFRPRLPRLRTARRTVLSWSYHGISPCQQRQYATYRCASA